MKASYGKLLSALHSRSRDLESCEDALASAFSSSIENWQESGVPKNPEAWIFQVAKNKLIDLKRKEKRDVTNVETLMLIEADKSDVIESNFKDERLKLLFVCAHPSIDESVRTPLMLQTVLGLKSAVIVSAFLTSPAAMMKKLVRAKQKIKLAGIEFEIPELESLPDRTENVTEAIFAAYGKSWDSLGSLDSSLSDLNEEAFYLAEILAELLPDQPETKGLLALILFCESRKSARRSDLGQYVPLDEQDTNIWNLSYISRADKLLQEAFSIGRVGRFQLEAAIQSAHCARIRHKIDNWSAILSLYKGLLSFAPTVGAMVGQANAIGEVQGPELAIKALDEIDFEVIQSYQPYWALKAFLFYKIGKNQEAANAYDLAIGLSQDESVKSFLRKRKTNVL